MKTAVFAGTFDPITIGHEEVIKKASKLFDSLLVVIGVNSQKNPVFSLEKRLEMVRAVTKNYDNVEVVFYSGMLVELMKERGISYTVRGVRNDSDYVYENYMHNVNEKLYPGLVTLFIPCEEEMANVSSTKVRNAIKNGEDLSKYLSQSVIDIINKID